MRTVTNAPGLKFYGAIIAAIVGYVLTQTLVDFPAWVELVLNAVLVGYAVWRAPPQATTVNSFALPGVLILVGAAAAAGDVAVLFVVVVVICAAVALYLLAQREYFGAVVAAFITVLLAIFLL